MSFTCISSYTLVHLPLIISYVTALPTPASPSTACTWTISDPWNINIKLKCLKIVILFIIVVMVTMFVIDGIREHVCDRDRDGDHFCDRDCAHVRFRGLYCDHDYVRDRYRDRIRDRNRYRQG